MARPSTGRPRNEQPPLLIMLHCKHCCKSKVAADESLRDSASKPRVGPSLSRNFRQSSIYSLGFLTLKMDKVELRSGQALRMRKLVRKCRLNCLFAQAIELGPHGVGGLHTDFRAVGRDLLPRSRQTGSGFERCPGLIPTDH